MTLSTETLSFRPALRLGPRLASASSPEQPAPAPRSVRVSQTLLARNLALISSCLSNGQATAESY